MSRMQPQRTSARVSVRIPEPIKDDFKDACDRADVTMSEVLTQSIEDFVDAHDPTLRDSQGYYPDDSRLREIYEAALDVAENGTHGPTIYQRRHARSIAKQTQEIAKTELSDALMPLRRRGFVAQGPMPPSLQGEEAQRWRNWIVKPPEADPDQWKFREGEP